MAAAKIARQRGRLTVAFGDVRDAARLGVDHDDISLAEAKLAKCGGGDDGALRAYAMLEPVEADLKALSMKFGVSQWNAEDLGGLALFSNSDRRRGGLEEAYDRLGDGDKRERNAVAKRLVLATDCLVDARLRHGVHAVVKRRAGKGCENPNFKGSYLGRFPLVSADFWTSDHLSERSRP